MSTKPKNELSPKHLRALDLIRTRSYTYRRIAAMVGWSEDYLQELIAGDTQKCGSSALLFSEEVKRIDAVQAKRIKELTKNTKEAILKKFEEFALEYKSKRTTPQIRKEMVGIMNAIAKSTPNVEIGSFTYQKGLSAEDLLNEFRRLKGIASDRRTVPGSPKGGTREIRLPPEPGDST